MINGYELWFVNKRKSHGYLRIHVTFYRDEQKAINSIKGDRVFRKKFRLVENDNNTDVLLFHSYQGRSHLVPSSSRTLISKIRIGNAVISFIENLEKHKLHKSLSSEFIELLCEMLSET